MAKAKQGIMASVLGRMASSEVLISDRHSESMLIGLLAEAEKVEDPDAAWAAVRSEVVSQWGWEDTPEGPQKPFIYNDGIAVIPVHGILVNRFPYCWGFITGYDFIRRQMNAALADEDVKLIVYDHDTPGGEAAGCDELAREIFASRAVKPSMALVNTSSCSGGFWLATPCTQVVCAPSGSVGSIGVYILTMNFAKFFAEAGIDFEFIKAGKFKTSGNMYEAMSDEDRAYLQTMVDERMDEFCAAVAEFRGVDKSVARGTEARVMRPPEAIALGLIDAAVSPAEAVNNFVAELGEPEAAPDEQEQTNMAELTAEERAAILKEERQRVGAITTCDEAKGRESLAQHIAHNTDMSVDDAKVMLAAAPKAEDPKPGEGEGNGDGNGGGDDKGGEGEGSGEGDGNGGGEGGDAASKPSAFEQAMDKGKHPEVGLGAGGDGDKGSRVDQILDAQSKLTGRKPKA